MLILIAMVDLIKKKIKLDRMVSCSIYNKFCNILGKWTRMSQNTELRAKDKPLERISQGCKVWCSFELEIR